MISFQNNKKILILGGSEISNEIIISSMRCGLTPIVIDNHNDFPSSKICSRYYIENFFNLKKISNIIKNENPSFIVCQTQQINIEYIKELEKKYNIIPKSNSLQMCGNKDILYEIVKNLDIPIIKYKYCYNNFNELIKEISVIGLPCNIKPCYTNIITNNDNIIINKESDIANVYKRIKDTSNIIIQNLIDFDLELSIFIVKDQYKINYSPPIIYKKSKNNNIYLQLNNILSENIKKRCNIICSKIVKKIGLNGIFNIKLLIKENKIYFDNIIPNIDYSSILTLKTQNYSHFDLLLYYFQKINIDKVIQISQGISLELYYQNTSINKINNYKIDLLNNRYFYYFFNKSCIKSSSTESIGFIIYLFYDSVFAIDDLIEYIEYINSNNQIKHI